jgi:hypothetical protein
LIPRFRLSSFLAWCFKSIDTFRAQLLGPVGTVGRALIEFLRPMLYLWPWILAAVAYALFLHSPQGQALCQEVSDETLSESSVISLVLLTGIFLLFSSLLTHVAIATKSYARTSERFRIAVAGSWSVALCPVYGVVFAIFADSRSAWTATGILVALALAGFLWAVTHGHRQGSYARKAIQTIYRRRLVLAFLTVLVAVTPLVVGAMTASSNPMWLTRLGPLLIGMVGLASLSTLFGAVLIVVPLCLRLPWLGVLLFTGVFIWMASRPLDVDEENPLLKKEREAAFEDMKKERMAAYEAGQEDSPCKRTPHTLEHALQTHTKTGQPQYGNGPTDRRVYLVSAEGGGIRAAYWTALSLGQLDISTGGEFRNEVATLSGVSGGSLGIATWLAAQERQELSPEGRLELMKTFLRSDFLSPLLAGFLFLDAPRVLLGPLWFSARRDHAFEKALADQWRHTGKTDFFARPFLRLCLKGFRNPPAIYLNATETSSGTYVPLTTATLPSMKWVDSWQKLALPGELSRTTLAWAPVAQMVHISARFPFLSPAAVVGIEASVLATEAESIASIRRELEKTEPPEENTNVASENDTEAAEKAFEERMERLRSQRLFARAGILVDGGYYDNTGLTPTFEALSYIAEKKNAEAKPRNSNTERPYTKTFVEVVHISNDPGSICFPLQKGWLNYLNPPARRFIEVTKLDVQCDNERAAIEASLRTNPLQWVTAPFSGIISVRGAHSEAARGRLDAVVHAEDYRTRRLRKFSVGNELADAYGVPPPEASMRILDWEQQREFKRSISEQLISGEHKIVSRMQAEGILTEEAATKHLKDLNDWLVNMRNIEAQMDCSQKLRPVAPPLGWTLTKSNQSMLNCLALRAAVKEDIESPPMPSLHGIVVLSR